MQIKFIFDNGINLLYNLNSTPPATRWLEQLSALTVGDLKYNEENHLHGFASLDKINRNISLLKSDSARLGLSFQDLPIESMQHELNKLHTEFPVIVKANAKNATAHRLNLLIHWLEYEIANTVHNKNEYLINIDFNHVSKTWLNATSFSEQDFTNFSTNLAFGNIHLHYTHIGRHFLEMFNANDMVCPSNQFVPMTRFNATCGLVFSETPVYDKHVEMKEYYDMRGGKEFFRYDFDNPRLAKGFHKIGELAGAADYTLSQRNELRQALSTSRITGWEYV